MNKWLKIDLHTHSFYSKDYDPSRVKDMTAEEYVSVFKNNGIDIFSITDHNCFSAFYYSQVYKEAKKKGIQVIPGAELNIYVNGGGKFQANFYFSLNTNLDKLESAIKELYKDNNQPDFSSIIDKFNENEFSFIIFPEADKSGGIGALIKKLSENNKIDEIKKLQKNGMQRIFRAYDSKVKFDKTAANMWAWSYYKISEEFHSLFDSIEDAIFNRITDKIVKNLKGMQILPTDEDFELVKNVSNKIKEYAGCFSYFHFSDWHNKEAYSPQAKNYIYGNSELPFESLELAVLDPISRLNILKLNENIPLHADNIRKLKFSMNGRDICIDFSIGLNAIVGKRASGKSLLMAVLLKLYNRNDSKLDSYLEYYHIDVDSISCETFDNQVLKAGQLGSLDYIEQNTISDIFTKPQESENGIKKYFSSLEEFDSTNLNLLISELKELKPYNTNYKSITSYINQTNSFKTFSFSFIQEIKSSSIDAQFPLLINSLRQYKTEILKIGFSVDLIDKVEKVLTSQHRFLDEKVRLYNNIVFTLNSKIKEIREANSTLIEQSALARTNYADSKRIILSNITNLLHFKKAKFLIDNFAINIPKMMKSKKDNYIFVSYYESKSNAKDSIAEAIEDALVRKGHSERGADLLKLYINGETTLKSGVPNVYYNIEKKFISDNLILKNIMYENTGGINYDAILTISDIKNYEESGALENITNSSLGRKSIAYLELILDSDKSILLFDQPEDNVDNNYISEHFVPLIKQKKKTKQLIFITHNPSVAVYADAFNYIYASNEDIIEYSNHYIESIEDKVKILNILDGGAPSFSNRNMKYGDILGEFKYAVKN